MISLIVFTDNYLRTRQHFMLPIHYMKFSFYIMLKFNSRSQVQNCTILDQRLLLPPGVNFINWFGPNAMLFAPYAQLFEVKVWRRVLTISVRRVTVYEINVFSIIFALYFKTTTMK